MPRPCVPTTRSFARGLNLHVVHRHTGNPALELRPVRAVDREERAELGADEQQIRLPRMLANHLHRSAVGKIAGDRRPRLAVVGALRDVRLEVVAPMPVERGVDRSFVGTATRRRGSRTSCRARSGNLSVFVHVLPPSRVTWISPSSVPTARSPARNGDSSIVRDVAELRRPLVAANGGAESGTAAAHAAACCDRCRA